MNTYKILKSNDKKLILNYINEINIKFNNINENNKSGYNYEIISIINELKNISNINTLNMLFDMFKEQLTKIKGHRNFLSINFDKMITYSYYVSEHLDKKWLSLIIEEKPKYTEIINMISRELPQSFFKAINKYDDDDKNYIFKNNNENELNIKEYLIIDLLQTNPSHKKLIKHKYLMLNFFDFLNTDLNKLNKKNIQNKNLNYFNTSFVNKYLNLNEEFFDYKILNKNYKLSLIDCIIFNRFKNGINELIYAKNFNFYTSYTLDRKLKFNNIKDFCLYYIKENEFIKNNIYEYIYYKSSKARTDTVKIKFNNILLELGINKKEIKNKKIFI